MKEVQGEIKTNKSISVSKRAAPFYTFFGVVLILTSLFILFGKPVKEFAFNGISIGSRNKSEEKKTVEDVSKKKEVIEEGDSVKIKALKIAKNKFIDLGETNLDYNDFKVVSMSRNGEASYLISSKENKVQIRKSDLKILTINTIKQAD